jgi:tRNA G26 N,N-dimethylase Trm1
MLTAKEAREKVMMEQSNEANELMNTIEHNINVAISKGKLSTEVSIINADLITSVKFIIKKLDELGYTCSLHKKEIYETQFSSLFIQW